MRYEEWERISESESGKGSAFIAITLLGNSLLEIRIKMIRFDKIEKAWDSEIFDTPWFAEKKEIYQNMKTVAETIGKIFSAMSMEWKDFTSSGAQNGEPIGAESSFNTESFSKEEVRTVLGNPNDELTLRFLRAIGRSAKVDRSLTSRMIIRLGDDDHPEDVRNRSRMLMRRLQKEFDKKIKSNRLGI